MRKLHKVKFLRNIFTNPIAIAVALVHWILVAVSLLFENTQFFSKSYTFGLPEPALFNWLLYLNTPSHFIIELIVVPVFSLFERTLLLESLGFLILICCISFQWMLIGYLLHLFIRLFHSKEVKISLN